MGGKAAVLLLAGAIIVVGSMRSPREPKESKDFLEIIKLSGLGKYRPPPPSVFEEKDAKEGDDFPKRSTLRSTGKVEVGPFIVQSNIREKTCTIKLYENLEGWHQKLRGTWSGNVEACDLKVRDVVNAVQTVRAQRKRIAGVKSSDTAPVSPPPRDQWDIRIEPDQNLGITGVANQNTKPILSLERARDLAKGFSAGIDKRVIVVKRATDPEAYAPREDIEDVYQRGVRKRNW